LLYCNHREIKKMGYSYKKIRSVNEETNTPVNKEKRRHVAKNLIECLNKNYLIIFTDEMSFNFPLLPGYGWRKSTKRIPVTQKQKSVNYSVVCEITNHKVLGTRLSRNLSMQKITLDF